MCDDIKYSNNELYFRFRGKWFKTFKRIIEVYLSIVKATMVSIEAYIRVSVITTFTSQSTFTKLISGFRGSGSLERELTGEQILASACFLNKWPIWPTWTLCKRIFCSSFEVFFYFAMMDYLSSELQNVKYFTQINSFQMNLPQEKAYKS